ncbi:MAG: TM7S3/TM198-like domain-containing protein [Thermomicrobiales bacterium]
MDGTDLIWGLVVVAAGGFICVYGLMLFKFALAAMGFGIGFVAAWWLLNDQSDSMRLLISLVVGAVAAVLLFALARFGVYVAGAILGLIIALVVGGLIEILGPHISNPVMSILAIGGLIGGGLFGHAIGQLVVLLATAGAGAVLVVDGLRIWVQSRMDGVADTPDRLLSNSFSMVLFLTIFAISALSQYNSRGLMRRVVT